jgi:hypothetical protein
MTRGTIHCINTDNTITFCDQFNGDMYLDGHGNSIIKSLENVNTREEFIKMVIEFNNLNHNYANFASDREVKFEGNIIKCKENDPISDPTYADYTYWKNISGKNITFIDQNNNKLILEDKGIAVFYFAVRYLKVYPESFQN